ncbi:condensation domain-containing protein [Actinomadura flavalba]|uniref:condensation domain-containing protein n=1 Tax=Actinomadura flavalba TaxID=1120938 RepID=UPI000360A8B4|nr:condensation domain-containing protein [Actinomadura flavalba]
MVDGPTITGIPLSLQHEFFCAFDFGDVTGAFGSRHVVTSTWRVRGPLDVAVLQEALDDLVERHEMLRTSIARSGENRDLRVHPPVPVELTVHDLPTGPDDRHRRAQEFLNEVEAGHYPVGELPHLRAALGRFADGDAVLVLVVHHIAGDGWSMRLLLRDLSVRYAVRRGLPAPELPPARQYREYAESVPELLDGPAVRASRAYWRSKLAGARMAALTAERVPDPGGAAVFADHRYLIDAPTTQGVLRLARSLRSTPFMILLSAYVLLLRDHTGDDDVTASTFSSGRADPRFRDTVGPFLNFLPLRVNLRGCRTFRDVVTLVRTTCLEAYQHDIPFTLIEAEAPGLMDPAELPDRHIVAFEVLQFPPAAEDGPVGGLEYEELRERTLPAELSCDIPDGGLWAMDLLPSGATGGSLKFDARAFDAATMWNLVAAYERVLRSAVADPEGLPDVSAR